VYVILGLIIVKYCKPSIRGNRVLEIQAICLQHVNEIYGKEHHEHIFIGCKYGTGSPY